MQQQQQQHLIILNTGLHKIMILKTSLGKSSSVKLIALSHYATISLRVAAPVGDFRSVESLIIVLANALDLQTVSVLCNLKACSFCKLLICGALFSITKIHR